MREKITMATKETVSPTLCIAALKEEVVDQILNAIGLKEMKTRSIASTMKNERKAPLELVMKPRRRKSDGRVDDHDCLIRGSIKCNVGSPVLYLVWWSPQFRSLRHR